MDFSLVGFLIGFSVHTIYVAWVHTQDPERTPVYGAWCYWFWGLQWLPNPYKKGPTQAELSKKVLDNKPPQQMQFRVKHTLRRGKINSVSKTKFKAARDET